MCPDFDLCKACEKKGLHSEHNKMKIAAPGLPVFPMMPFGPHGPKGVGPRGRGRHGPHGVGAHLLEFLFKDPLSSRFYINKIKALCHK